MNAYWTIYFMNNTTADCPLWLAVMLGALVVGLIAFAVWVIKETWIK